MTQYSGVYTLQTQGQALTSGQWATDPYYKNTTLLLHADGVTPGSQNNTFIDESPNSFAIIRNGNTTQGTFSPYGPDWSNYFSSSAMLNTSSSASFDFGTGDFTLEAWVNLDNVSTFQTIFSTVDSGISGGYSLGINSSGFIEFDVVPAQSLIANSYPVKAGAWNHIAFTKSSGTYRAFVNGVLCTTSTNTLGTTINSATGLCIGKSVASGYSLPLTGYISNARIVKGTALYTSNFAPSTFPLTNVSGTSILTCQSNRFVDNSSSPFSLTVTASPSTQRFSPFPPQYQYTTDVIGGAAYLDGSGDSLQIPMVDIRSATCTVEFWAYIANGASDCSVFNNWNSGASVSTSSFTIDYSSGSFIVYSVRPGVSYWDAGNGFSFSKAAAQGVWHHVALTSDGSTSKFFVDGELIGTGGYPLGGANSTYYTIGANPYYGSGYMKGYVAGVRVLLGTQLYTTAFTPPTAPPTSITNTQILLNMTAAGIYDNAMMNNLETVGNAQVSASVVKYGSGSMYYPGSSSYLSTASNKSAQFGSGDFTIEGWLYPTSISGANVIHCYGYQTTTTRSSLAYLYAGNFRFGYSPDGSTNNDVSLGAHNMTANNWYHFAVVRTNGVVTAYVNGIALSSPYTISTNAVYNSPSNLIVGSDTSGNDFVGYIDDYRITKGVARYTANFIPPKVAFANQ